MQNLAYELDLGSGRETFATGAIMPSGSTLAIDGNSDIYPAVTNFSVPMPKPAPGKPGELFGKSWA